MRVFTYKMRRQIEEIWYGKIADIQNYYPKPYGHMTCDKREREKVSVEKHIVCIYGEVHNICRNGEHGNGNKREAGVLQFKAIIL